MRSTPMLEQYWALKREVPGALLLYRLGDFYELFFEDAEKAAPLLGLVLRNATATVTSKPDVRHSVSRGGFLHREAGRRGRTRRDRRADRGPHEGKSLVARKIVRIVTPGTMVDPERLEARRSNELLALVISAEDAGAAFLDVSTGSSR